MLNYIRARIAVEWATREAVRLDRQLTWVAGVPRMWGVRAIVHRRLWDV